MTSLREFAAIPAGGDANGVDWIQTMGKITLSYSLGATDVSEADVEVKITGFQVEVQLRGEKIKALTGDLYELVRPAPEAWWVLPPESGMLVLQFTKVKHGPWPECFYSGSMHPRKKGRFAWTKAATDMQKIEAKQIRLNEFEIVPPGRPDQEDTDWYPPTHSSVFSPKSDGYLCSPDDIVIGAKVSQDSHKLYLTIGFDHEALAYFESQRCYEDLFGADIATNSVFVFLRGDDQNPIVNATLTGELVPSASTWKIVTDEDFRQRQKATDAPGPALQIILEKAVGYCYEWPRAFESCWQHRFMVKNLDGYEEALDAMEALQWTDDDTDPEYKASLQEKAAVLDSFVEERFEGISDAHTYRRHGYDIDSGDYWANVYDYVNDTVRNHGYASPPAVLGVVEAS